MKKTFRIILVQIFLLVFFGTNLFAVELWNGFTTDMSPEQVEKICDMMLQHGYMIGEYTFNSLMLRPMPYSGDLEHKNNSIPDCAGHISYKTYQEQYDGNLLFYFRKGKLYAIEIPWRLGGSEIIQKAKETLGNNFSLDICRNEDFLFLKGRDENVYHWILDDREIYFSFFCG